ncbi:MAG: phospholipase [Muribaculaceae bacterium]|nr:phospholipase [Muribaculaceae bacterium]
MATEFISGADHYRKVIEKVASVRKSLWIGTADIKDLYVKAGDVAKPFLGVLADLLRRGVEIRLIHAKEPGPAFREDFDRFPVLKTRLERMQCPRVHFKMMIFDFNVAYIGSANLTGAGIGMKSDHRRNFEAGILTDDPSLIEAASEQFDSVWRGNHCARCGRRQFCPDPIK